MAHAVLNKKGQISIEFLIIIIVSLIYIHSVTKPILVDTATAAAEDVKRLADAKIAAQRLADAINEAAAASGESKKTIHVFLPANASVSCNADDDKIDYSATISNVGCRDPDANPEEGPCDYSEAEECIGPSGSFECSSSIALLAGANPSCPTMEGPLYMAVEVIKNSAGEISVGWQGTG